MFDDEFHVEASMSGYGALLLRVVGELDAATSDELIAALSEWLGITELTVDLSECTLIDSRGLKAVLECRHQIGEAAEMRLVGVPSNIEHTLRLAGLETVLGLDRVNDPLDAPTATI